MYLSEQYEKKWQPVLEHPDLPKVKDSYRRAVTATILENQERPMKEDAAFLSENAPTNATGSAIANWDPILISLVRRACLTLLLMILLCTTNDWSNCLNICNEK